MGNTVLSHPEGSAQTWQSYGKLLLECLRMHLLECCDDDLQKVSAFVLPSHGLSVLWQTTYKRLRQLKKVALGLIECEMCVFSVIWI